MSQRGGLCQGAAQKYDGEGIKRRGKEYLLMDFKNSGFGDECPGSARTHKWISVRLIGSILAYT
jgi:hypothetical protein